MSDNFCCYIYNLCHRYLGRPANQKSYASPFHCVLMRQPGHLWSTCTPRRPQLLPRLTRPCPSVQVEKPAAQPSFSKKGPRDLTEKSSNGRLGSLNGAATAIAESSQELFQWWS